MSRRHGGLLLGTCLLLTAGAAPAADPLPAGALARRAPDRDDRGTATYRLAFAPDGKAVFVCGRGAVRLWHWKDGRELKRWPARAPYAASPDGRFLGAVGKVPQLYETFAREKIHPLAAHSGYLAGLAVSADGHILASADQDRRGDVPAPVRLWAIPSGKLLHTLDVGGRPADHLAFSPDGKLLATGGCPIRLWSTASGALVRTFAAADGRAGPLAFRADGKTLASAGTYLRLWDVATGTPRRTLTASDDANALTALALTPDGKTLASAGTDRLIHLWDCDSGRELAQLPGHDDRIEALAVPPDGKMLASCSADGKLDFLGDPLPPGATIKAKGSCNSAAWSELSGLHQPSPEYASNQALADSQDLGDGRGLDPLTFDTNSGSIS